MKVGILFVQCLRGISRASRPFLYFYKINKNVYIVDMGGRNTAYAVKKVFASKGREVGRNRLTLPYSTYYEVSSMSVNQDRSEYMSRMNNLAVGCSASGLGCVDPHPWPKRSPAQQRARACWVKWSCGF